MLAWLKSIFSSKEKEKKQAEEEEKEKKQAEEEEKEKKQAEEEENEKKQAEEESKEILKQIQKRIESKAYIDLKQIYVAVVGQAGVGKSTLINSILSAAQNKYITLAPTGQGESITKRTFSYNVMLGDDIELPISLIDCRGIQYDITVDNINKVIAGDRELLKVIEPKEVSETNDKNVTFDVLDSRTASIAFLVFSANWVKYYKEETNRDTLEKIIQTKTKLKESGIPSFVILTKIDEIDESVKCKILDFESTEITDLKSKLANWLKINVEDIIPVWNITGPHFNVKQRCHILRLLQQTVWNGLEHARQCKAHKHNCYFGYLGWMMVLILMNILLG